MDLLLIFFLYFLPETFTILCLALSSVFVRFCLLKVVRRIFLKINQPRTENIPLQQEDKESNVIKILRGSDKVAIEDLIVNAEDDELNKNLRFLSLQNVAVRRQANKNFMDSLVDIYQDRSTAILFLKNKIDFAVCQKVMDDWEYSGELANFVCLFEVISENFSDDILTICK